MTHPDVVQALLVLHRFNLWRWSGAAHRGEVVFAASQALAIRRSRRTWLDQAMSAVDADEGEG